MAMQVSTTGNALAHIILRGDQHGPNYGEEHIADAVAILHGKGLLESIVVDASHGNSGKNPLKQIEVVDSIGRQVALGQRALVGIMIESHLVEGRQPHDITNPGPLEYGKSITDGCAGLDDTSEMLDLLSSSVRDRRRTASIKV
jgi:3-deoxy-7-phosphoheptulonate synthase